MCVTNFKLWPETKTKWAYTVKEVFHLNQERLYLPLFQNATMHPGINFSSGKTWGKERKRDFNPDLHFHVVELRTARRLKEHLFKYYALSKEMRIFHVKCRIIGEGLNSCTGTCIDGTKVWLASTMFWPETEEELRKAIVE